MRLLPTPSQLAWGQGDLLLPNPLPIRGGAVPGEVLAERLGIATGIHCVTDGAGVGVEFATDPSLAAEEYRLSVTAAGVRIVSADVQGAGWAVQTLLQLLPTRIHGPGPMEPASLLLPLVEIQDRPRYGWRGSMIDVVRHFLPLDGLLKHLEIMAMHKLNVLHLHLSDDQGWRLPVAKYPLLTAVGGWRPGTIQGHQPLPNENDCDDYPQHDGRPHGGSYTVEEIKQLVAAANRLGITVVPEIDMPGHMEAAIAAYPWLGACDHVTHPRTCFGVSGHVLRLSARSLQFCRDVLDTVMELFPDSPIHVGGDECPHEEWFTDPVSKQTMAEAGVTDGAAAQAWFEREICSYVIAAGRTVIAWDEVLEGGAPEGTVVTAWRNRTEIGNAISKGHNVIATPAEFTYLDYAQYEAPDEPLCIGCNRGNVLPLEKVAGLSAELEAVTDSPTARLLGGQFQLWTEYVHNWNRAESNLWPRGACIAQQLWAGHPGDSGSIAGLGRHLDRLTAAGLNWRRPPRENIS